MSSYNMNNIYFIRIHSCSILVFSVTIFVKKKITVRSASTPGNHKTHS